MTTFTASVLAADPAKAIARVTPHLPDGFTVTEARENPRHPQLMDVIVENDGGDVDACWVALTSYGISPSKALGSSWRSVKGVGR